ncbi:MAG TPA: DUF262 domain-containing HNH endonuclease family protein [Victivallales bacterium]|nr:DUF262 domain-containing HNH endonuclease family protein [Victivallales bacterium]
MESKEQSLRFLTLEGKIIIPFFQRTYVWNEENWEELFEELSNNGEKTKFLGAIILKQLQTNTGEPKKLEVIDGQQRLTTISILIKTLFDNLQEDDKKQIENDIKQILFFKRDAFGKEEIRIDHSNVDKVAFESVLNGVSIENINEKSHRILKCYKYFFEKINSIERQEDRNQLIKNLLNTLLNTENKMLVVIDLKENDDEQKIFDTLNTAGVTLTSAEIIKNALFKKYIELIDKEKAISFYKNTWENTFLINKDTTEYWETERLTGRLKRDNIEILLHSIGVIKGFFDPGQHVLSELSKLYKKKIHEFNDIEELKSFIEEIIGYAKIYKENMINFDNDVSLSFDDNLNRLLHILDVLEISTFHPFILYVLKKNQKQGQKTLLLNLEKFIIRNLLSNKYPTKNYNKLCKQFINDNNELNKKLEELTIDNCINGLKHINNKYATLILFWIELYRRNNDSKYDIKELKYDYSLEHIMPQSWEDNWSFDKVPHPNTSISGENSVEKKLNDRKEKIDWIGNMTLLRSKLNSSLKNSDFEKKMNGENRKKGIIAYADLSITKDDIVTPFNNGDKIWNEDKIEKRTNSLFNEIKKIWG